MRGYIRYGIAVNSFNVLSYNQIAAISPSRRSGSWSQNISVSTPGGNFTLPDGFTVKQALPTIAAINPIEGNQETTFNVTIQGTNLTGASEVSLGQGIVVNSFTVLSSNQITANISIASGP
jgi:hypothetical protein